MPVQSECFTLISFLNWLDKQMWKFPLSFWVYTLAVFIAFLFTNITSYGFVLKLKYCTEATASREFRNAEHNMLFSVQWLNEFV